MLNIADFRRFVIRPTLEYLNMWSPAAERLVLGTALTESNLHALDQGSDSVLGPAYGLYQIEPWVADDVFANYLAYRPELKAKVEALLAPEPSRANQLVTNLAYQTAICRLIYWRRPEPLPETLHEQAEYWKRWYNTYHPNAKGKPEDFVRAWRLAGLDGS